MARKKILYTHELPYHVMARSNNKEWFYLPISQSWQIFTECLRKTQDKYGLSIYIFVLMDNHYHLVCQCSEKHSLGEAMNYFQQSVSKAINKATGRINHVFGGPYKGSLIRTPSHFAKIYKYVARNPVTAGITKNIQSYQYSTHLNPQIEILPKNEWFAEFPNNSEQWLNEDFQDEQYWAIHRSLKKPEFKLKNRVTRRSY
ncbi:MAG: transposase [Bacillota bacterium]